MNAIIALCHFCDTHGPRHVICTQAINRSESKMLREAIFAEPDDKSSKADDHRRPGSKRSAPRCKSCQSLGNDTCLVSYDEENEIYYISSESPRNASIFHLVRTVCLRSLYSEQTQGRGGSILFGHDNCMVGCNSFFLRDLHSRGHTRLYSLQLILNDKFMSTSTWSYIIDQFNRIADQLTECADLVFEEESAAGRSTHLRPYAYTMPSNLASTRSLADITALPDIATRIHSWFTWILRSLPQLMTEDVLEGQPTEDQLVDIEYSEDKRTIDDGDVVALSKDESTICTASDCKGNEEDEYDIENNRVAQGFLDSIKRHQEKQREAVNRFDELRFLLKRLGTSKFTSVLYHVVVGNQVIVRCDHRPTTESLIHALEILLPRGCCQSVPYSTEHVESFRANLLGTPLRCDIAKRQSIVGPCDDRYLFLDVHVKGSMRRTTARTLTYWAKIRASTLAPNPAPKIVTEFIRLIDNAQISSKAALSKLGLLKQEWIMKSKIYYAFSRFNCHDNCEESSLLRSLHVYEQDMLVVKFWQKGISHYQRQQILQIQAEQTRGRRSLCEQVVRRDRQSLESLCSEAETLREAEGSLRGQRDAEETGDCQDQPVVGEPGASCDSDTLQEDCCYDWDDVDSMAGYDLASFACLSEPEPDVLCPFAMDSGRPSCVSLHDVAVNFSSSFGCGMSFMTGAPAASEDRGMMTGSKGDESGGPLFSAVHATSREHPTAI